ncbi:hypothetical protein GCM10007276_24080 [Agaricicola taiwanensis]|uniref:O-antigen ligase-related domain-containing protein n=1 Tax=Agaricicola taiwanensis TaxID=591372 RepID=A0A8J2YIR4_9RHOB|nr:O-antigen ligase family protein [Agaricicola taiwanensis]GGE46088.1 hypothetical protein GCM10007276_24080 [Agaricicola taiwanensis]
MSRIDLSTLPSGAAVPLRISLERLACFTLGLLAFSGFYVMVEPSPYEFMMIPALLVFVLAGLRFHQAHIPLLILLTLFNIGGAIALLEVFGEEKTLTYVIVSIFMGVNAIFFAACLADRTLERFTYLRAGYILAAVASSLMAIVGYFDVAGLADAFTLYGRAKGSFKDPNVFGPFLILPALLLLQDILLGKSLTKAWRVIPLGIILIGLFLTFSRGAWAHFVASTVLMIFFLMVTLPSPILRLRILLLSAVGAVVCVVALSALLTVPAVGELFETRAKLGQQYDLEEGGRFDNQATSIPILLEKPAGLGPYAFGIRFGGDPHNVYLNAFAAYGWLGGFSYATLIVITWISGLRQLFKPSPFQRPFCATMATFMVMTVLGFIIDTDHWRHFFMLLGINWGFIAAVLMHERRAKGVSRGAVVPAGAMRYRG